jgi:hypothetical protein
MNPFSLIPPRWVLAALLAATTVGAFYAYSVHLIHHGESLSDARHAAEDAELSRAAQDERNRLNRLVAAAQADLAVARARLIAIQQELDHEKADSARLQSDLAVGRQRLQVLVRAADQAGSDPVRSIEGGPAGTVDHPAAALADLDGTVAANLEWLRSTRNEAIDRLDACVRSYDAVKAAADAISAAPPAQQ